ncbi:MAG: hypothetical protein KF775_08860 [Cyclobacteriaceae bacterium]|nr:hypothetical protein [Cyclobacteriaceae bacterium]
MTNHMKTIYRSLALLSLLIVAFSCADESLDPLQFEKMKKGIIIALRGDALNKVYVQGNPIEEIFPRIATGTEKFEYEAEILADDPSVVASVDIYVIKRPSLERVFLKNIPASSFTQSSKYLRPAATISITIQEVLTKLGLPTTFPMSTPTINELLTSYKFGVGLESDLNLTDGSKVLAADIVAAGLFQSNQFYPAMILTWAVTDYCTYEDTWAGPFDATESSEFFGGYGPYTTNLTKTSTNNYSTDNFYDSGWPLSLEFTPSTSVATQTVIAKPGTVTIGANVYTYEGSGTYNQCLGTVSINMTVKRNGDTSDVLVWKLTKK